MTEPKKIDVEHTERGTELVSPTGRAYFVSDFEADSQEVDFLWLLPVDRKTTRRRRLYQADADKGWAVKPVEPAAEPEPAAPEAEARYRVQRWSPATGSWLFCGGSILTAMTRTDADSYADLLRTSSPAISYRVVPVEPAPEPAAATEPAPRAAGCLCPTWEHPHDYDGPEDYARACAVCPVHG